MLYALCSGVNRYGGGMDLAGCVNDARDWAALAADFVPRADVVTLQDKQATREAILAGIADRIAANPLDR